MFVLTGALPLETIDWNNVHEKYLGPGMSCHLLVTTDSV